MFNQFILQGRLTKELEPIESKNGGKFVKIPFASNRNVKNKSDEKITDFFDITVFGKSAEFAIKHFHKGTHLIVTGHIQSYLFEKDGKKFRGLSLVADKFDFLSSSKKNVDLTDSTPNNPVDQDDSDEPLPF